MFVYVIWEKQGKRDANEEFNDEKQQRILNQLRFISEYLENVFEILKAGERGDVFPTLCDFILLESEDDAVNVDVDIEQSELEQRQS